MHLNKVPFDPLERRVLQRISSTTRGNGTKHLRKERSEAVARTRRKNAHTSGVVGALLRVPIWGAK